MEEGYFLKEGSTIKTWRKRWICFKGTNIQQRLGTYDYWKTKEQCEVGDSPRGQGMIQSVEVSAKRAFAVHIVAEDESFHLQCRDEAQRRKLLMLLKPRRADEVFDPDATTGETLDVEV